MATVVDKLWTCILIIQVCLVERCEAYTTTWWSVWYFWVVMFGILACCCGAAGSYYRRRQYVQMRRNQHTVIVGRVPVAAGTPGYPPTTAQQGQAPVFYPPYSANPSDPYVPPAFPTGPVQPPSYTEGVGNQGYHSADNKDTTSAPPPAYSEVMADNSAYK